MTKSIILSQFVYGEYFFVWDNSWPAKIKQDIYLVMSLYIKFIVFLKTLYDVHCDFIHQGNNTHMTEKNLMACVEQIQTSNSESEISEFINQFCCSFPFPGFHIPPTPQSIFVTSNILHSSFHSCIRYPSFLMVWRCPVPQRWVAKPFLPGSAENTYTNIPIYMQQDATLHSLFISRNCSTCFGWYLHPSSGAHTTVSTASGICHTITATCR